MSALAARRRLERVITDYLLSMDAHVESGRIEVCPDLYGVQAIKPCELKTTVIHLDRLAEIIVDEMKLAATA